MQIGSMNNRIAIQAYTSVADGMGGFTNTYATWKTVWSAIWPTSARDVIQGNAPTMAVSHRIRIRYLSGLTTKHRVLFGTRYFAIVSIINPSEKGEWLDLLCNEVTT